MERPTQRRTVLIDVKCPHCRDTIPITEAAGEQAIDCPGCGKRFTVGSPGGTVPPTPADTKSKPVENRKKPARRRYDDDDDDDDDDDRPRRGDTGGAGAGMIGILIAGGIGLLILAGGFGLAAYLIFSKDEPRVADARPVSNPPPGLRPAANPNPQPVARTRNSPPPPRITPLRLKSPTIPAAPEVKLPAPAGQVVVGGGGKYLFLHLKTARQVAVFEPAAGKVVKFLPLSDDDAILAAGLNHLLIAYPKQRLLSRYSLATFERDKTIEVPAANPKWAVVGMGMGAGSNGPLLVAAADYPWGGELFLIDVLTMRRAVGSEIKDAGVSPEPGIRVFASHDGRTFATRSGAFGRPTTFQVRPSGWVKTASPCDPPLIGAGGDTVYGPGQLATVGGQQIGEKKNGAWYVPAVQGPFFLALASRTAGDWPHQRRYFGVDVHAGRDQAPLVSLPELPEAGGAEFFDSVGGPTKPLDQHFFYAPSANLLVILPPGRDRLHLRKLDLKAGLAKEKGDYLVVVSTPPTATAGRPYRYAPRRCGRRRAASG